MSNLPKIETLEYNIVEELKNKKATVVEIAGMDGTIETKKISDKTQTNINNIILIILFTAVIIALIIFSILNFTKPRQIPPITQTNIISSTKKPIILKDVLPILDNNVGRFTYSISNIDNGYAIGILNFSAVYSYILKNELSFARELQILFKIEESTTAPSFKDITLSNQDMRILSTEKGTVVYAFLENKNLILSTSTEGILTIKNVILSR